MINERLENLRRIMAENKVDAYLVTTSDPHQSEYIPDHYKTREYISGFTGSQGSVVVTKDKAILWTDGRYFVQAEEELKNSEFELYKMGNPNYPNIIEFMMEEVRPNGKIGFCGTTLAYDLYRKILKASGTRILIGNVDYVGDIWEDRPSIPRKKVFLHEEKYSGLSPSHRIGRLRKDMKANGIDYYLISALDEIAYLYSIRGSDVSYNPVSISYGLVSMDKAYLFIDEEKIDDNSRAYLNDNGIDIEEYDMVASYLSKIGGQKSVFFDPSTVNISLINNIKSNVRLIKDDSIIEKYKAVKNNTEISHQKNAYIKDGVALTKFFNWLDTGVETEIITEVMASSKLLDFRKDQDLFVEPSFETISAYGPNAAMPHYSPSNKGDVIRPRGLYLVDSGGQYLDGTTDITRTVAYGDLKEEEIYHYTMVLKSHISLASALFKKGTTGYYLDAFAKYPLLKEKLDFNHGTGHGVGFFLNVHEGPQSISFKYRDVKMEPGMVVSIEPGIYIEGSHGVRIENIATVVEKGENEFGEFLGFEILSYVPIDTKPVDKSLLTKDELDWLNNYNQQCYDKLEAYLAGEEKEFLTRTTKKVMR